MNQKDQEWHFILFKGTINQEGITILDIYTPNSDAPNFINTLLLELKTKININPLRLGGFSTQFLQ